MENLDTIPRGNPKSNMKIEPKEEPRSAQHVDENILTLTGHFCTSWVARLRSCRVSNTNPCESRVGLSSYSDVACEKPWVTHRIEPQAAVHSSDQSYTPQAGA